MPYNGVRRRAPADSNRSTAARIIRSARTVTQRFNCHQLSWGRQRRIPRRWRGTMISRPMSACGIPRSRVLVLVLALTGMALGDLVAPHARAQSTPAPWSQPRTLWGDPDLEGVWTSDNNFAIPLERPPDVADKEFLDGKDLEDALAARAKTIAAVADGGVVGAGPSHWYENLTARSRRSSLIID